MMARAVQQSVRATGVLVAGALLTQLPLEVSAAAVCTAGVGVVAVGLREELERIARRDRLARFQQPGDPE